MVENEKFLSQIPDFVKKHLQENIITNMQDKATNKEMLPINEKRPIQESEPMKKSNYDDESLPMQNSKKINLDRRQLMRQLSASDFAALELHLYLNTHPDDEVAMELFNQAVKKAKILKDEYERRFAPLTASSAAGTVPWKWIQSPWTWEQEV